MLLDFEDSWRISWPKTPVDSLHCMIFRTYTPQNSSLVWWVHPYHSHLKSSYLTSVLMLTPDILKIYCMNLVCMLHSSSRNAGKSSISKLQGCHVLCRCGLSLILSFAAKRAVCAQNRHKWVENFPESLPHIKQHWQLRTKTKYCTSRRCWKLRRLQVRRETEQ